MKVRRKKLIKESVETPRVGDTIRIIHMDDCDGKDTQAQNYNGKTGEIEYIDDAGQLHGTWGGLAVLPDVDEFEIIL